MTKTWPTGEVYYLIHPLQNLLLTGIGDDPEGQKNITIVASSRQRCANQSPVARYSGAALAAFPNPAGPGDKASVSRYVSANVSANTVTAGPFQADARSRSPSAQ